MQIKNCRFLVTALVVLPLVAACSEKSLLDTFNSGNSGPEAPVATNQSLTLPPDLSLRQPGAASAPAYSTNRSVGNGLQVQQGQRASGNQVYQAPPPPQPGGQPAWQNAQPQQPAQQQAYAPSTGVAPAPTPGAQNAGVAQRPTNPADEPYLRNGINPYNADGTRKKQSQLDAEARAKKLEQKRASNPNYGTVFNAGELWSGN